MLFIDLCLSLCLNAGCHHTCLHLDPCAGNSRMGPIIKARQLMHPGKFVCNIPQCTLHIVTCCRVCVHGCMSGQVLAHCPLELLGLLPQPQASLTSCCAVGWV
jgi:hypothetical protein